MTYTQVITDIDKKGNTVYFLYWHGDFYDIFYGKDNLEKEIKYLNWYDGQTRR